MGKKKKQVDFFLLNLAIADLGFLLFTFPLGVIKESCPSTGRLESLAAFICIQYRKYFTVPLYGVLQLSLYIDIWK